MVHYLLVGLGGFFGAAGRYGLSGFAQRLAGSPAFPVGTLVVNVLGCLAIGVIAGVTEHRGPLSAEARVLMLAGVLGGFTTFSAFGFETIELMREGHGGRAVLNVALQVAVGLGAVWGGWAAGRQF